MKKKALIKTNMDNKENIINIDVIINNNIISYFDNDIKMQIDLKSGLIYRYNNDYHITINPNLECINIELLANKTSFDKNIKIIDYKIKDNYYYIKYFLVDENVINEFELNIWLTIDFIYKKCYKFVVCNLLEDSLWKLLKKKM